MDPVKTQSTLQLVDDLTDQYVKSNYPAWNRRKRKAKEAERLADTSADSQTIKYADIIDNSAEIAHQDTDFAKVFLRECNALSLPWSALSPFKFTQLGYRHAFVIIPIYSGVYYYL